MIRHARWATLGGLCLALATPSGARAQEVFNARLNSYQEVPTLSSTATGQFTATLAADGNSIQYMLTYSGFSTAVTAAHVHLGRHGVAGGISAFLCGGGNKPACPAQGQVTGTIVASDIIGPTDQGLAVGDFAALVRALAADAVYANVHTTRFPNGEIRGQLIEQLRDD